MPRRSERNINLSVEYIYEFPEDDTNSDTVTAQSDIDVSSPSSSDKENKKESTEDMKNNVASKSSDDKNIEVKPKKDNLMTQPVDVGKKKGQPNPSEDGSAKVKLVGKSSKPANAKEIVTRSKSKISETEVASVTECENSKSSRSEQPIRNVGSNDEQLGTRKEVDEDSSVKNVTDKATPEISSQPIIRRRTLLNW